MCVRSRVDVADDPDLTTLSYGGQSNQVISIIHLLHLASLTGHIAIVPSLVSPHHIADAPAIPASRLFDFDHYRRQTGVLVAEWADLKAIDSNAEVDDFVCARRVSGIADQCSCYSLLREMFGPTSFSDPLMAYAHSAHPQLYPLMTDARRAATGGLTRAWNGAGGYLFESLVTWLEAPGVSEAAVAEEYGRRLGNVTAERARKPAGSALSPIAHDSRLVGPDPRLTCVDSLFFVQSGRPRGPEIELDWGVRGWSEGAEPMHHFGDDTSWRETGRHLRFTADIEREVSTALRTLLGVGKNADIPPFIAMHIRRGDFATTPGLGLASVDTYAEALVQLSRDLDAYPRFVSLRPSPVHPSVPARPGWTAFDRTQTRAGDLPVVVATDETDPRFLAELDSRGWIVVDHALLGTANRFDDPWMPSALDQGILSRGAGLVMTAHSVRTNLCKARLTQQTYSSLAGLRVRWWNGGTAVAAELPE